MSRRPRHAVRWETTQRSKIDLASYLSDLCGRVERNNKYPDFCRVIIPFKYTYTQKFQQGSQSLTPHIPVYLHKNVTFARRVVSNGEACHNCYFTFYLPLCCFKVLLRCVFFFEIAGMHQANSKDSSIYFTCFAFHEILGDCKCKQSACSKSRFSFAV